jgi:tetratricopeptide (TPR) repeat protein
MLNEAGLIFIGVLIAAGLVVLGALELVWPTRPRYPIRGSARSRDPWRRARARSAVPSGPAPTATAPVDAATGRAPTDADESVTIATSVAESPPSPHDSFAVEDAPRATTDISVPDVVTVAPPPPVPAPAESVFERPQVTHAWPAPSPEPLEEVAETPASARPEHEFTAVERCFTLLEEERYAEVVAAGEEALEAQTSTTASALAPAAAEEMARLWGVVGLAKQALEDLEGARFAFEEAIALAPGTERLTWERYLMALALTAGRQALSVATEAGPPRADRVNTVRSAIEWLERGLAVAPDDADIREALASAHDVLWPAYEAAVRALVRRQEFVQARRVLEEVMADPECPPAQQSAFRSLLAKAMGGEVGQATASAIRHMEGGREDEAVAALARADSVMEGIATDALSARQRQELERGRWRAYMKLGTIRVEGGVVEAALGPLFRALSFKDVAKKRHDETRAILVRTLGAIVEAQSAEILRLIDSGAAGAASVQSDKLWGLLRSAADQGLPEDDFSDASAKVLALFDRLGDKRPGDV